MYAQRLDNESEVTVKEAKSGDMVKPGQVLIAPGDKQMRIVKINNIYQVECRVGPKVSGHCPSVDVLFESVARVAGKNAIGVLMTGMGSDGANGLLAMKKQGREQSVRMRKPVWFMECQRLPMKLGQLNGRFHLNK